MADAAHLLTTVKNITSATRTYGYLGFHGKTLAGGASYTQFGDVADFIAHSERKSAAFQRDLIAGKIYLIRTPRPILKDATSNAIKALNLSAGTLGVVDPSYGSYVDT